jgi:hypothetical protein
MRQGVEVLGWLAVAGTLWVTASIYLRPSTSAAQPDPAPARFVEHVPTPAEEIRGALRTQPDIESAEVTVFTRPGESVLVVVSLTWATPTPPPRRRLQTIARWARERFGGTCRVHVVTPTQSYELNG